MGKAERQKKIEEIIVKDNRGWRKAELARKTGVHRSTIGRDMVELSKNKPFYLENGKIYLDSNSYLTSIAFTAHEIIALQQACVHMLETDEYVSSHMATAVDKLSRGLAIHAPLIKSALFDLQSELKEKKKQVSLKEKRLQEKLNMAWMKNETLDIQYLEDEEPRQVLGKVCRFEMNNKGFYLHVDHRINDKPLKLDVDQLVKVSKVKGIS